MSETKRHRTIRLVPFTLAWCCTALVVHQLPALPGSAWIVPAVLLALFAIERPSRHWLLGIVAAAVWTAACAAGKLEDRLPAALTGDDFEVVGWVDGFPAATPERTTFSFRVEQAEDPAVPRRLRLGWYDAPEFLVPGAVLALTVRLRSPRGLLNPGGFDYEQWLLVEGYGATGYVRAGAPRAAGSVPSDGSQVERKWNAARWWLRVRLAAAEAIAASAPDESAAALLTALAIGERFRFTERQWTDLRRSGTSHLVAISGIHVGMIALAVFWAIRRLWLRLPAGIAHFDLEAAAVASAAAAIGYAALAGFAVPTQRSVVMIAVALMVVAARRTVGATQGIAAAALAVTALDPFAVLSASFWMSFGAVALLLWLAIRRDVRTDGQAMDRSKAHTVRSYLRAFVLLQCTISFGLVPITALFFGELSLVAPFANLVAIPYFNLVLVPVTLIAVLASYLDAGAAPLLIRVAGWFANGAWSGIHAAAAPAWSALVVGLPTAGVAGLALLGAVVGLPAHPLPARFLGWFALLPLFVPHQSRPPPGSAEITMLDVGHGLAVVIETHGHRLLYDAGPSFPTGYDSGTRIVVPALTQERRNDLDMIIVSHADNDHAGGAAAVLAAFPRAAVLAGPDVTQIPGERCEQGQQWVWDDVSFEVLHPPRDFVQRGNESSCVLKVTTAHGSLLITGDAESRAERLLALDPRVRADVVVVGHHGSATSSRVEFVAATDAKFALVSAGYANRWGFPRPEVAERWRAAGAELWVTGDSGALSVSLAEGGITVAGRRHSRHRYWRTERPVVSGASDLPAL